MQVLIQNATCSYASFFLYASITIMATVCQFFPSHLVGIIVVGVGVFCSKCVTSLFYGATNGANINTIMGLAHLHPISSGPVFEIPTGMEFEEENPGRNMRVVCFTRGIPGFKPALVRTSLLAQIEE